MEQIKVRVIGKPIITDTRIDWLLYKRKKVIFDFFDNEDNLKEYEEWLEKKSLLQSNE